MKKIKAKPVASNWQESIEIRKIEIMKRGPVTGASYIECN